MFNIFFIAGFAVVLGFGLAILVSRKSPRGPETLVPVEEAACKETPELRVRSLSAEGLFRLGQSLCGENGLEVKEKQSGEAIYWIAESRNPFFYGNYVLGFIHSEPSRPLVTLADVLEFKDFIKGAGSNKGFLFTNGYFTRDVHQPLEGPKVGLYNRQRVFEEMHRLGI